MFRFAAFFAFFLLAAISSVQAAEKGAAYENVLKTGVLRCAYTSVPTYVTKDLQAGQMAGPLVEIAEAMVAAVNLKVEWVAEVGHADFAEGLKTGRYDAYCGILAMAPTRARVAAFTTPLFYSPYYAHVRKGEKRFKSLEDMNRPDVTAGGVDGEVFQLMTRKYLPQAKEWSLPNMTPSGQLFVDLADGKVDVVIHDPTTYIDYEKHNPGKVERAFGSKPIEVYPMAFAVSPYEPELRDMLNVAITSLQSLGKIDAVLTSRGIDEATIYRVGLPYKVAK